MLERLKFWLLRKLKPKNESVKESYSKYIKNRCRKTISRLQYGFTNKKYWIVQDQLLVLMRKVGSPFSFKKPNQFFDTFEFTADELVTITGDSDEIIARERIENVVSRLLTTKKFRNTYWERYIEWFWILAP